MWLAAILAVAIHLAFIGFLVFGVTWQNSKPEAVSVDLYAPPGPQQEKTAPPKSEPAPKVEPEPPKPQPEPPKPPPKVEPPQPTKADIALKEKQERDRKLKEDKDRKDVEKRLAEVRDKQAREAAAVKEAEGRQAATAATAAAAARATANASYIRSIQAKVKGNVLVPPDIPGNPEAIFEVVQLPTGEIIDAQLKKSSGVRAYDEALQRAITKSSPLPKPESLDLFQRSLTLRFRPLDQ